MSQLYQRHSGLVYRFSLRLIADESTAEEITQDVFLALLSDGKRFDPQRASLSTWLRGIARRLVWKHLRRRDFTEDELDDTLESPQDDPFLTIARDQAIATVEQGLDALPPALREAATETVQKLADGNRIVRHNATKLYRDSAGRTRREQTIAALSPSSPIAPGQVIVISDPVASIDFILDESRKTVRKITHFNTPANFKTAAPQSIPLGTRVIEGLECTGSKTTVTIPAGSIGNERPIVTVTVNWYARAIEELVRSTTYDPRFGETNYTLRNIVLGEPPQSLFQPPSNYQVQP
jgi:RNA polymerase sigma factor (sigma-70 family)